MILLNFVFSGGAQLAVRPAGDGVPFPDPADIVVGFASDLTLQVQCLPEAGTEAGMVTWRYRNGTVVLTTGLEAFGVSQGGGDGVLRVHPVAELRRGNEFVCSDGNGTDLDVTFVLG